MSQEHPDSLVLYVTRLSLVNASLGSQLLTRFRFQGKWVTFLFTPSSIGAAGTYSTIPGS